MSHETQTNNVGNASLEDTLRAMIITNTQNGTDTQPSHQPQHVTAQQDALPDVRGRGRGQQRARGRGANIARGRQSQYHVPQQSLENASGLPPQGQMRIMQRGRPSGGAYRGQVLNQRGHDGRSEPSKFVPLARPHQVDFEVINRQQSFLDSLAATLLPSLQTTTQELDSKDQFRMELEQVCREALKANFPNENIAASLQLFGSLGSGFAMPGSDMDLALVISSMHPEMPRLLEKALLERGVGARLLSRTRVPIIKVCELPHAALYQALVEEREKWDSMTPEEREKYDLPQPRQEEETKTNDGNQNTDKMHESDAKKSSSSKTAALAKASTSESIETAQAKTPGKEPASLPAVNEQSPAASNASNNEMRSDASQAKQARQRKQWFREKPLGPLDFPKEGVGIQCDINFNNPLGLHNTDMLRCYAACDPRVRAMVLFVKAWASRRKINSSRHGTLSSYGYVLMVLHFLVNVADPPLCPNLQLARQNHPIWPNDPMSTCEGWDIRFWRNEEDLREKAAKGFLNHNRQSLGALLRDFFLYYAQQGTNVPRGGFAWTMCVLSLRTYGGILTKQQKEWTGAKTTVTDNKEVRHRFLFAIEDPFELDHNVARTVTHFGIVAIRDEFRRAWRIVSQYGRGQLPESELLAEVEDVKPAPKEGESSEGQKVLEKTAEEAVDEQGRAKPTEHTETQQ